MRFMRLKTEIEDVDQFGHVIAILVKMLFEQNFVFVLKYNTSYFC